MYINPIVLGVACTLGGECVLIVLGLTVAAARYIRRHKLDLPVILRLIQSWVNSKEG